MTFTINYLFWLLGHRAGHYRRHDRTSIRTHPRRLTAGSFWLVYALIFLVGDWLAGHMWSGCWLSSWL